MDLPDKLQKQEKRFVMANFLRVIIVSCLLLVPGIADQQKPPRAEKDCNCEAKFKTCKQFAKSKAAKKLCDDDRKDCLGDCKPKGVG